MAKYKYQFQLEFISLSEDCYSKTLREFPPDKEKLDSIQDLIGLPISIILEEPEDSPYDGTWIAQNRAEDKASEAVAAMLGLTFGGTKHLPGNQKDADLYKRFLGCRLVSMEQV